MWWTSKPNNASNITICEHKKKNGIVCKNKIKKQTNENKCIYHQNYGKCGICFDDITMRQKHETECNHVFHKHCIDRWNMNENTCPLCRFECKSKLQITKEYFRTFEKRPYYGPYFLGPEMVIYYNEIDELPQDLRDVYDGEIIIKEYDDRIIIRPIMY